jgi:hypothetical protein
MLTFGTLNPADIAASEVCGVEKLACPSQLVGGVDLTNPDPSWKGVLTSRIDPSGGKQVTPPNDERVATRINGPNTTRSQPVQVWANHRLGVVITASQDSISLFEGAAAVTVPVRGEHGTRYCRLKLLHIQIDDSVSRRHASDEPIRIYPAIS